MGNGEKLAQTFQDQIDIRRRVVGQVGGDLCTQRRVKPIARNKIAPTRLADRVLPNLPPGKAQAAQNEQSWKATPKSQERAGMYAFAISVVHASSHIIDRASIPSPLLHSVRQN